ncbi:MAG TPA: cyclodeaminase/cyclohydrolase family protein [Candidatus Limnocylindrales bacterium]|nr:cyclodeaminase/cyclohydrolase family protein [Candidatus Limnocylindrales bacterium]
MSSEQGTRSPFGELKLAAFVEQLASAAPVPGGGSASAVAASVAASLVAMVASLSQDRPKYAAHVALHARSIDVGRRLAARFLELADADADAYATFSATLKLPRDTDDEKARRLAAMSEAARKAADVPLAVVEGCQELVASAESLVGRSNANAASDLNVAALLAEAAARGAAENVYVNLPSVDDEAYRGEMTARVMRLIDDIEELAAAVHAGVRDGSVRDPLPE